MGMGKQVLIVPTSVLVVSTVDYSTESSNKKEFVLQEIPIVLLITY